MDYVEKYRAWSENNPQLLKDIQTFLRGLSYVLTGYLRESVLLSEFVFSTAQLLTLANKRILEGNLGLSTAGVSRLEDFLRVLNCVEVCLELATLKLAGPLARWALIFSLQVVKSCVRLLLLSRTRKILISLDIDQESGKDASTNQDQEASEKSFGQFYFTLKTSGRVIRKIQGAPPVDYRSWVRPSTAQSAVLTPLQLIAETVYALKPVLHLMALGISGEKAWSPFMLALGLDCVSQGLHLTSSQTTVQRKEIFRRWLALLGYILRSPFYDQKSKSVILCILSTLEKNLPLGGSLVASLRTYIPEYQKIYFYVW